MSRFHKPRPVRFPWRPTPRDKVAPLRLVFVAHPANGTQYLARDFRAMVGDVAVSNILRVTMDLSPGKLLEAVLTVHPQLQAE